MYIILHVSNVELILAHSYSDEEQFIFPILQQFSTNELFLSLEGMITMMPTIK